MTHPFPSLDGIELESISCIADAKRPEPIGFLDLLVDFAQLWCIYHIFEADLIYSFASNPFKQGCPISPPPLRLPAAAEFLNCYKTGLFI
ncbi:hypothetical protein [Candidatus Methylomicrobium oryzae]|uniref:hypothetical protein n=1 Tax=Candidatus Methylomicrobium oryzae TaxID=2802053 RepID=UPI001922EFEE|nr:hypothetical protein [Methylomicrobium sp. RS1]MBL1262310.1 hypothetical protein [Methylomicrobium sp. RS1]